MTYTNPEGRQISLAYVNTDKNTLSSQLKSLWCEYEQIKSKGYKLDLTRGKPCPEQLELSSCMLAALSGDNCISKDGVDCRNYGVLDGLPETKELFSELLDIPTENIIVGGNSSLNLMYDTVVRAMLFGVPGGKLPWSRVEGGVKFLCPAPGYDRHFAICETLGIKMIPVAMKNDGPDMDTVEELVSSDETIKGIWCVPKYSNPTGITYSDDVVRRFAALRPKAKDFRIFWDNAYAVHDLYSEGDKLLNLFDEAAKIGPESENMIYYFASTSKITFPGSGVAIVAASKENVADIKRTLAIQTIGYDKLNQLRHVRCFPNAAAVRRQMELHAEMLRPKFEIVKDTLKRELEGTGAAVWTNPKGGYFVSLDVMPGCATRVYNLCRDAGVRLTDVGATFPYKHDPEDKNLRIAPTFPSNDDLATAMHVLTTCVKIAAIEKCLNS